MRPAKNIRLQPDAQSVGRHFSNWLHAATERWPGLRCQRAGACPVQPPPPFTESTTFSTLDGAKIQYRRWSGGHRAYQLQGSALRGGPDSRPCFSYAGKTLAKGYSFGYQIWAP
jgi:hypothetical protein